MKNEYQGIKFAAYCRKSSEQEERQALSIDSQIDWVKRVAIERGIIIQDDLIFTESKSAKKSHTRKRLNDLIDGVENGRIQGIVSWSPDRLSRNAGDAGRIIDLFDERKLHVVITHQQTFVNTPSDKFFFGMLCSQAKMENDNKGENVKRGLVKKSEKGHPPYMAKIGFLDDRGGDKGYKEWKADPVRFPLVVQSLELLLTGKYSVSKLWEKARDELKLTTVPRKREGGKPIARSQFYNMIADPIYAGFFYHGEKRYELASSLPRAVTEKQHEEILRMLRRKGKPRPQKHVGLYNYFMKDGNGGSIAADHKEQLICTGCKKKFACKNKEACPACNMLIRDMSNATRLNYVYYQSIKERKTPGVKALCIEEKKVDSYLANHFEKNLAISKELSVWCIKHIGELADKELKEGAERLKSHTQRKQTLEVKLSRLLDIRLSREGASREDAEMLDRKEAELKAELATLQSNTGIKSSDWLPRVVEQFDLASEVTEIFKDGELPEKKDALSTLGSNLTLNTGKVSVVCAETVEALMKGLLAVRYNYPEFEPKNIVDTSSSNPSFVSLSGHMLRR